MGSIDLELSQLKKLLGIAHKRGAIKEVPEFSRALKKGRDIPKTLSVEEVRKLFGLASPEIQKSLALAFYAGLRLAETRHVRWQDVNFEAETITVENQLDLKWETKNGSGRVIALHPTLLDLLKTWKSEPGHFIVSRDGKQISRTDLGKALTEVFSEAGVGQRTHGKLHLLRHSYATTLSAAGLDVANIAQQLGHRLPGVTFSYLHANLDLVKAALRRGTWA